jgi:3-oxoacyl-[acyl-carrier protein] reductase
MMNQRGGHIINISSISAVHGRAGQANYSAAKAGLIGLTKTAAKELGRYDIKVNAVLPGYLNTAMGNMVDRTVADGIMRDNALGRISDPGEVAEFVYRLSLMSNVSGQVFNLDSRIL